MTSSMQEWLCALFRAALPVELFSLDCSLRFLHRNAPQASHTSNDIAMDCPYFSLHSVKLDPSLSVFLLLVNIRQEK